MLCVLLGVLMRFRKLDLKKKVRVKKKGLITYYFYGIGTILSKKNNNLESSFKKFVAIWDNHI